MLEARQVARQRFALPALLDELVLALGEFVGNLCGIVLGDQCKISAWQQVDPDTAFAPPRGQLRRHKAQTGARTGLAGPVHHQAGGVSWCRQRGDPQVRPGRAGPLRAACRLSFVSKPDKGCAGRLRNLLRFQDGAMQK